MGSYIYMTYILLLVLFLVNVSGVPVKDDAIEDFTVRCEEICELCHCRGEALEYNVCQCLVPKNLDKEDQICLNQMKENAKTLGIILKSIFPPNECVRRTRGVHEYEDGEQEGVCLKRETRTIYRDRHGSGRLPLIVGQEREEVGNARDTENAEEVAQNIEFENAAENVGKAMSDDIIGAPLDELDMEDNEEAIVASKFKKAKLHKKLKKQKKLAVKKMAIIPIIANKKISHLPLFAKSATKSDHLDIPNKKVHGISHGKRIPHVKIDKGIPKKPIKISPKFSKSHIVDNHSDKDDSCIEIDKDLPSKNLHIQPIHTKKISHTGHDIPTKKIRPYKNPKFGKSLLGSPDQAANDPDVGAPALAEIENVADENVGKVLEIHNEFEIDDTLGAPAQELDVNVGAAPEPVEAIVGAHPENLETNIEADSIVGMKHMSKNHIIVQPPNTLIDKHAGKSSHVYEIDDDIIIGDPAAKNEE